MQLVSFLDEIIHFLLGNDYTELINKWKIDVLTIII